MAKRTYENCKYNKKYGEAGKDANGKCMGFGKDEKDDEPCEPCKKCECCTSHEDAEGDYSIYDLLLWY